ncbi:hypothetical protein [Aulosira sp. FACHB-615]|uniref:hypothetical protein n=1 Tax=Aulosira sp. FACHB-615 TaxID=2692777 RepID=UPI001684F7E3|nr:hypothetical protein [Aulosira sp. FACHB-615]MBD2492400.1 hypothetical protein [Aulosira sp. FACHB-615]
MLKIVASKRETTTTSATSPKSTKSEFSARSPSGWSHPKDQQTATLTDSNYPSINRKKNSSQGTGETQKKEISNE